MGLQGVIVVSTDCEKPFSVTMYNSPPVAPFPCMLMAVWVGGGGGEGGGAACSTQTH